ncbi:uncharacterized protein PV07_10352 [Cladophialophora immunda]|uniref:NadR/Ttd14 AAA domain-containing protein n=1 Tax=Cladophialophora immunda TaxID=569365 RepID=A0A0D2BZX3_9EURO|nr:uncharacterized protein PV07_10352 [Cladophialophora immunda]KIW24648.1 hypothetical protein PV07_10352 [Cladophialophora immunda]OQV00755.1 AAA domain-containing protein [Cladophialophora immunda]
MEDMPSIYIIGAQCTGKTTLVEAVSRHIRRERSHLSFTIIKELARGVLVTADVNRDDIRAGTEKAMNFQRLVLKTQLDEEQKLQNRGFIISDRSGIDPIAYANLYGPPQATTEMLGSSSWAALRKRMCQSIVILSEPVLPWLFDDGVRLMPEDISEWFALHNAFISLLQQSEIKFESLPATCNVIEKRVAFVLEAWETRAKQAASVTASAQETRDLSSAAATTSQL